MNTLRVTGGRVLRPDGRVTESDVTIDRDAGTIVAVGDETVSDAEAGSDAEVASDGETLDASGSLVIPGLVNAHTRVAMLLRGYADDKPLDPWLGRTSGWAEAELTPDDIEAGAELGVVEMIRSGTTAFADMYFAMDRVADVVDRAGLRARLGHGVVTIGKDAEGARADDVEESLAVARELDGAGDGRIRTAFMPHSLTTVGEEYLHEGVAEAREAGVPIHLHANETEDEVDPIVDDAGSVRSRTRRISTRSARTTFFAHGASTDDGSEIDQIADAGTAIVHRPASNMKLASGMAPVQRLRDAGVTVALGTDGAASNNDLDVFDEMRDAAMLGKLAADDATAVPAEAVVEMATAGGADALGSPAVGSSRARPPTSPSLTSTPAPDASPRPRLPPRVRGARERRAPHRLRRRGVDARPRGPDARR